MAAPPLPAGSTSQAASLHAVLAWEDDGRILSVYVDGRETAVPGNATAHAIRLGLGEVAARLSATGRGDTAAAERDLAAARADVEAALGRAGSGSFAVFAHLGTGARERVDLDGGVTAGVTLGRRAHLRPLWQALTGSRPAGVVAVSGRGARVAEWTPSGLETVWEEDVPPLEERDLVGPAPSRPRGVSQATPGSHSASQRDLYEQRIGVERERFFRDAAARAVEQAKARAWSEIAIAGDAAATAAVAPVLAAEPGLTLVPASRLERWRSDAELAQELGAAIGSVREQARLGMLSNARDAALAGGAASLGVQDALQALAEGRVRVLLLPATLPLAGRRGPDGAVYPEEVIPPDVEPATLEDDPQLGDLLIRDAVAQSAEVVVLAGAEEAELAPHEVAALLRW